MAKRMGIEEAKRLLAEFLSDREMWTLDDLEHLSSAANDQKVSYIDVQSCLVGRSRFGKPIFNNNEFPYIGNGHGSYEHFASVAYYNLAGDNEDRQILLLPLIEKEIAERKQKC